MNIKSFKIIYYTLKIFIITDFFNVLPKNKTENNKNNKKNICFVIDQYGKTTNGCISFVKEWSKEFIKRGYAVSIICGDGIAEYGEKIYKTGTKDNGIVNKSAKKQGFPFAKVNKNVVSKALKNIDIVHFITPFELSNYVKDYCDLHNIPTTVTFATLPDNVSHASGLSCKKLITSKTNSIWKKFYDKFKHCNTISKVVDDYLIEKKYKSQLHMFYIGVNDNFRKFNNVKKPNIYNEKFVIISIGRLSNEKRQDLIIKAVGESKYKDKIKLIIAGSGPNEKKLKKLIKKYNIDCEFNFYSREELINVLNYCDLYIHAADIEAMGMSALEAICCGVVPIINDAKLSGTKEFALSDKNLFNYNDYKNLTEKIDYFIENPTELQQCSQKYINESSKYRISKSVDNLIKMMKL